MKKTILLIFVLLCSLYGSQDYSQKKIKLLGEKKQSISKRVSIKNIEKIAYVEFLMIDPYTKKETLYGGVTLDKLVNFFAKDGVNEVIFTAIDGYVVSIDKKTWTRDVVLLSTRKDKKYVNYEEKGPLRIVFPNYNSISENYTNNLPKWIWMIKTIEFK